MQKSLIAAALAVALGMGGGGVQAADMYAAPSDLKEGLVRATSWTGFYGGVNGGYAWSTGGELSHFGIASDCGGVQGCAVGVPLDFEKLDVSPEGGFGGGQVGYNWQAGRFVVGLEADIQGADLHSTRALTNALPIAVDRGFSNLDWYGTVRGRLGFTALDRALLYATGGFAYGGVEDKLFGALAGGLSATESSSQTATGYVIGGGLEYAVTQAWSVKAEYQYMNLGDTTLRGPVGGAS